MANEREFEPGEMDLPEGWSPESDNDPQWLRIVELTREADAAPAVPPARFQAMKLELRRKLVADGILHPDAPIPRPQDGESFGGWLRQLLLGGGAGGQFVRLGAVGALAFAVGTAWQTANAPQPGTALVTPTESSPSTNMVAQAPPPAAANPAADPAVVVADAQPIGGMRIERSSRPLDWNSTAPRVGGEAIFPQPNGSTFNTGLNGARAVTVSAAPAQGMNTTISPDLAAEAFDQLQVVKFYSIIQQDDRTLAEIRRVEQTLSQMLAEEQGSRPTPAQARELYRRAEQLQAIGRFGDAIAAFERVVEISPESSLSFLARFQIGRIAFEDIQDYALATEAFEDCAENYPSLFINARYQAFLDDHLSLLRLTAPEQWSSLRAWQNAKKTRNSEEALRLHTEVVATSPSPVLTVDSADRLRDILLTDIEVTPAAVTAAVEALGTRIQQAASSAHAARLQFNRAEILARRRADSLATVAQEYERVLQLANDPNDNMARAARVRLNLLRGQIANQ